MSSALSVRVKEGENRRCNLCGPWRHFCRSAGGGNLSGMTYTPCRQCEDEQAIRAIRDAANAESTHRYWEIFPDGRERLTRWYAACAKMALDRARIRQEAA